MNERTIYLAALDITDPAERSAYLDRACAGNAKLRQQVDALLAADARSGEFLNVPALRQMADNPDVTQTYGEKAEGEEFDLSYLTPSTKPGSLGTLGHYEVMQVLGQGGFGTVLKAFDEKLHRLVAIKVLSRQLAATSPPRKRFLREARAVAAIKHENVVQVYSVEEHPLPYIVMEFVDGSTLQDKMDEAGPLGVPEVLHIGREIAAGLAAAHSLGLIHRDIKPANILMEKGVVQKVKITDFGLARTADDASLTQSGTITGTPLYMAPEQAKAAKLDHRADLFSLGSVLYALACGHPPFRAATTLAVLMRVANDTPRPLQEIIPETPDWFVAIIDKLLAKEPADRFQTAQEVADLLGLCQSNLQAGVTPSAVALGLKPTTVEPVAKAEPKRKKFPVAGVAAGIVLMVAVMAAGLFFLNKNDGTVAVVPPATPAVAVPAETADADRKAAEYALSIGGIVQVNGKNPLIKNAADLPNESFKLTSLSLAGTEISDTGLGYFKGCRNLQALDLGGTKISNLGLSNFSECKSFSLLALSITQTGDVGLLNFKGCQNLTQLYLNSTQITEDGITNFLATINVKSISTLHLASSAVTVDFLASPKEWEHLSGMQLQKTKVTATKFEELKKAFPNCKIESDYGTYDPSSTFNGMEFVKVPKGTGWLGGGAGKQGETKVVIEHDFYLGKYEVTQEEWEAVTGQNPSHFSRTGAGKDAVKDIPDADLKRFPVDSVSWDDCQLFIKRLNENEKDKGWVYRLPKEAEWEYACRGVPVDKLDSAFDYYFAKPTNTLLPTQANFATEKGKGLQRTCKVGSYEANLLGLYDMHGNLHEWCDDTEKRTDGASHRVGRGGSWDLVSWNCRATDRNGHPPAHRASPLGVRLARVPVGPAATVPATTDPDRKAAEWVLSIGGRIGQTEGNGEIFYTKRAELPNQRFQLNTVVLSGNLQVTDAGLQVFKDVASVTVLYLNSTAISDSGLANFKGCKDLGLLVLGGSQLITDSGLENFKECKNLTSLLLSGTRVTDTGMAHFGKCTKLQHIHVNDTKVSDAGLAHIMDCKNLISLDIGKTKVTAAKFEELKKAFPKCKIESDYGTYDPSSTFKNSLGMEFVKVPKGTGWLGGGAGKQGETKVVIEQDFYLGKYEVTQEEWENVMGHNKSSFRRKGPSNDAVKDIPDADLKRFPVEQVSWDECQLFIARLNKKEQESGWEYRLPTTAEWEYACRGSSLSTKANTAFDYYFATPTNTLLVEQANFDSKATQPLKRPCKVGSYPPNSLGLHDMHGNVHEWCVETEKVVDGTSLRVGRGGSWSSSVDRCRATSRYPDPVSPLSSFNLGLRLARVPVGPAVAVPATTDPDRKAAEWVLSIGGTVRVDGKDQDIKAAADLPRDAYQLTYTHLDGNEKVSDAGLANFKDCVNVTKLWLPNTLVSDAGLANFTSCKRLTHLGLGSCKLVSETGLAHFKNCDELIHIDLIGTEVSDAGLANFKERKTLIYLDIRKTKITAAKFEELKKALPKCKIESDYGTYEPK